MTPKMTREDVDTVSDSIITYIMELKKLPPEKLSLVVTYAREIHPLFDKPDDSYDQVIQTGPTTRTIVIKDYSKVGTISPA